MGLTDGMISLTLEHAPETHVLSWFFDPPKNDRKTQVFSIPFEHAPKTQGFIGFLSSGPEIDGSHTFGPRPALRIAPVLGKYALFRDPLRIRSRSREIRTSAPSS